MKRIGLGLALACVFSVFTWAEAQNTGNGDEDGYVPRSQRDSKAVFTFKGSGKGLVIIDHKTGEVTRYTTKRQKALHKMSPEAEESARSAWESKQSALDEYKEETAKQEDEEAKAEMSKSDADTMKEEETPPSSSEGDSGGQSKDSM